MQHRVYAHYTLGPMKTWNVVQLMHMMVAVLLARDVSAMVSERGRGRVAEVPKRWPSASKNADCGRNARIQTGGGFQINDVSVCEKEKEIPSTRRRERRTMNTEALVQK